MSPTRSILCRLGFHRYDRSSRDAGGRFWCRRCGEPGTDRAIDTERMPPTGGGTGAM